MVCICLWLTALIKIHISSSMMMMMVPHILCQRLRNKKKPHTSSYICARNKYLTYDDTCVCDVYFVCLHARQTGINVRIFKPIYIKEIYMYVYVHNILWWYTFNSIKFWIALLTMYMRFGCAVNIFYISKIYAHMNFSYIHFVM